MRGVLVVTIASCNDILEANYLKMLLESAGIPVFIPDAMTASIAPHHFLGGSGVRVQVAEVHAQQALEIIAADNKD